MLYDNIWPIGGDAFEIPDETGRKRKPDRLVITGGVLGPHLMLLHSPEEDLEEKDPNP